MTDRLREAAQTALDDLEARCGSNAGERGPDGSITKLRAALAEQDAEPVAWANIDTKGNIRTHTDNKQSSWANTPLYLHPPRREWVSLTDEEIADAIRPLVSPPPLVDALMQVSMDE